MINNPYVELVIFLLPFIIIFYFGLRELNKMSTKERLKQLNLPKRYLINGLALGAIISMIVFFIIGILPVGTSIFKVLDKYFDYLKFPFSFTLLCGFIGYCYGRHRLKISFNKKI
jgi:hypothetical protein